MKINNIKEKMITLAWILGAVAIMYIFQIPCLFKTVFHIECPGCGITRAYISLLSLDIRQAFAYNAAFWTVPVYGLVYLFDGKLFPKKWMNFCLSHVVYVGLLVNWICKLAG